MSAPRAFAQGRHPGAALAYRPPHGANATAVFFATTTDFHAILTRPAAGKSTKMATVTARASRIRVPSLLIANGILFLVMYFMSDVFGVSGLVRQATGLVGMLFFFAGGFLAVGSEMLKYLQPDTTVERPILPVQAVPHWGDTAVADPAGLLAANERPSTVEYVGTNLSHDTVRLLASEWEQKFKDTATSKIHIDAIRSMAADMQARLQGEIAALGRRANVKLVVGIGISALGLAVLGWLIIATVNEMTPGYDIARTGLRFGVRMLLVIFMGFFAYLFLRLYRFGIGEIKYFQNEITGAQLKLSALEGALMTKDKKTLERIAMELARAERNFILKKGETTVALQRDEVEKQLESTLSSNLGKLLRGQKH